jgi:hypothetical protein
MGRKSYGQYKAIFAVQAREKRRGEAAVAQDLEGPIAGVAGAVSPVEAASEVSESIQELEAATGWSYAGAPDFIADLDIAPFPALLKSKKRVSRPRRSRDMSEAAPQRRSFPSLPEYVSAAFPSEIPAFYCKFLLSSR